MSLRYLLVDAVGQLYDVETTLTPDGAITWSRAQRPFAVLAADGAFSDPAARAAASTPTSRSVARSARRDGRRVTRCDPTRAQSAARRGAW